jgi:hypothetical protein
MIIYSNNLTTVLSQAHQQHTAQLASVRKLISAAAKVYPSVSSNASHVSYTIECMQQGVSAVANCLEEVKARLLSDEALRERARRIGTTMHNANVTDAIAAVTDADIATATTTLMVSQYFILASSLLLIMLTLRHHEAIASAYTTTYSFLTIQVQQSASGITLSAHGIAVNFGMIPQHDQRSHTRSIAVHNHTDQPVTVTVKTEQSSIFTVSTASELRISALQTSEVQYIVDTSALEGKHENGYPLHVVSDTSDEQCTSNVLVTADIRLISVSVQPAELTFGSVCEGSGQVEQVLTITNATSFSTRMKAAVLNALGCKVDQSDVPITANSTVTLQVSLDTAIPYDGNGNGYVMIAVDSGSDTWRIPISAKLVKPCFALAAARTDADDSTTSNTVGIDSTPKCKNNTQNGIMIAASCEHYGMIRPYDTLKKMSVTVTNKAAASAEVIMQIRLGTQLISSDSLAKPLKLAPWRFILSGNSNKTVQLQTTADSHSWSVSGGSFIDVIATATYDNSDSIDHVRTYSATVSIGAMFVPKAIILKEVQHGCTSVNSIHPVNRCHAPL